MKHTRFRRRLSLSLSSPRDATISDTHTPSVYCSSLLSVLSSLTLLVSSSHTLLVSPFFSLSGDEARVGGVQVALQIDHVSNRGTHSAHLPLCTQHSMPLTAVHCVCYRYLKGGVASAFNHVEPGAYVAKLLQVRRETQRAHITHKRPHSAQRVCEHSQHSKNAT